MAQKEYSVEELLAAGFTLDELKDLVSIEKPQKGSKYVDPSKSVQEEELNLDPLRAAVAGAVQGVTFGLGDQIIGDTEGKIKQLESEYPSIFLAGEVAGSLLTPVPGATALKTGAKLVTKSPLAQKLIQGAGTGAIAGGLQAMGAADEISADAALEGAQSGALVGGSLTGVLEGVPAAAKAVTKLAIPSPASREKIADVFNLAKEQIKTTGEDITDKPFIEKQFGQATQDVTKFVENLLNTINKKRQDLYEKVAEIADKSGVKLSTANVVNLIDNLGDEVEPAFKKALMRTLPNDKTMSYRDAKNLEEKIEKYIKYPSTPFATKEAAIQLKSQLRDMTKSSLPEEGLKALEVADNFYKRIAGIDPKTGEAIGDFYAVTGKNITDLPKYDKAAMADEITRISNRLLEQGQGLKYNVADPYYARIQNFDQFVKEAGDPNLVKDWEATKDQLSKLGLLTDVFEEGTKVQKPSLANLRPETIFTKVAYSTAAATGKAAGQLEKTFAPLAQLIPSMDPALLERKIAEFEQKGNKGIADYLRHLVDRFNLERARTTKPAKIAAQQFVEAQNPGLKDLKRDLVGDEEE